MIIRTLAALMVVCFCLTSCLNPAPYIRPKLPFMPKAYQQKLIQTEKRYLKRPWWCAYHDKTLNRLVRTGLMQNYELKELRARMTKAQGGLDLSRAEFFPAGNISSSRLNSLVSQQGIQALNPRVPRHYDQNFLTFESNWEVDLFGRRKALNNQAYALLSHSVLIRLGREVSLAASIVLAYNHYRSMTSRIEINENMIRALEKAYRLNRVRFKAGIAPGTEASQAKALLTETRARLPELYFQQQDALYRLSILTAVSPNKLHSILHGLKTPLVMPPPNTTGIPSDLLRLRPDVQAAEQYAIAGLAEWDFHRRALYPEFILSANGGFQSFSTSNLLTSASTYIPAAGPTLRWRILDYWRIKARTLQAKGETQARMAHYQQVVLTAVNEVESALVSYQQKRKAVVEYQENLSAQWHNERLVTIQFQQGLLDYLNVVIALRQRYLAQETLVIAKQNAGDAYATLAKALGGGVIDS